MIIRKRLERLLRELCPSAALVTLEEVATAPLFIDETSLLYIADQFIQHRLIGGTERRHALRELFETFGSCESYLLTDKGWRPGFTTSHVGPGASARLRSSAWSIDAEDPLFNEAPFVVHRAAGMVSVKRGEDMIRIDVHAWQRFAERCLGDPGHKIMHHPEVLSRRHALKRLALLLRNADVVKRKNNIKQLLKYRLQETTYYTSENWILPVTSGGLLVTAYQKDDVEKHGYTIVSRAS